MIRKLCLTFVVFVILCLYALDNRHELYLLLWPQDYSGDVR